jgi:acyl-coenzyme A synthetase/AMP-(fatty) acid ligase
MSDAELNITFDLIEQARLQPEQVALVLPERDISYRELDRLAWRSAQYLQDQGVRAGDVVALSFENELLMTIALLGIARLGATIFPIPRLAGQAQALAWMIDAKASWFLTDTVAPLDSPVKTISINPGSFANAARPVTLKLIREDAAYPLMILIGSGTTGKRKLIAISHALFRRRMRIWETTMLTNSSDRSLSMTHMEYGSVALGLFSIISEGASMVLFKRGEGNFLEVCADKKVSRLGGSVFHFEFLLKTLETKSVPAGLTLNQVMLAFSTVTSKLRERLREKLGDIIYVSYGTNESWLVSVATPATVFNITGTVGKPVPGIELEIVDLNGKPVARNIAGHIRIRSPGLIGGYLGDQEASESVFRESWFYPGDMGRIDESGELIFCGRSDDTIIKNGINIYPAEIENCLFNYPGVKDVFATSLPHPVHQDIPICVVACFPGVTVWPEALEEYARDNLGSGRPDRIFVVDSIPRHETGKILKPELFEKLEKLQKLHD